jgi:hypothetical protein
MTTSTKTASISKEAALTQKVSAMTRDERHARLDEIFAEKSAENDLEMIKLVLGPDATILPE